MPKILGMSRQLWEVAKTKISAGPSCVTGPAELNEMVQYNRCLEASKYFESYHTGGSTNYPSSAIKMAAAAGQAYNGTICGFLEVVIPIS